MVSLSNLLTIGIIGAGIAAFIGLGGAQGIGSKIGQGFRGLGESFVAGISNPLSSVIPTVVSAGTPSNNVLSNLQKQAGQLQSNIEEAIQAGTNLGGSVNPEASAAGNIATKGDTPTIPQAPIPIATSFKSALESGIVEPAFAQKYSFVAPQEGKLDVSKTFQYIADPVSVVGAGQASTIATSRAKSGYGGYGSSINQSTALAAAIQASAAVNPEFFR